LLRIELTSNWRIKAQTVMVAHAETKMDPYSTALSFFRAFMVHLAAVGDAFPSYATSVSSGSVILKHTARDFGLGRDARIFNRMSVSPLDPQIIFGDEKGLQLSRDGGETWTTLSKPPGRVIDLATSATDVNTLYTATQAGLFISNDGGSNWKPLLGGQPVSMIEVTPDGFLYAFVIGRGVVRSAEEPLSFEELGLVSDGDSAWHWHVSGDPRVHGKR
jgi:hypothetical protein